MIAASSRVLAVSEASGTLLLDATPDDFAYIESLRQREGNSLGFIPKESYLSTLERREHRGQPGRHHYRYEKIVVTKDNGDYTGFAYVRFAPTKRIASIWQIAVQEDARRWHRALLIADWIEAEALRRGCETVKARVAADIESNLFWQAAGYEVWGETASTFMSARPSRSGRRLLLYVKHLSLPWQTTLEDIA